MNFRDLQNRLAENLRVRVRRGEITERGLARLTGVSQPHIHHVLNGKRLLSADMADQVMAHLRMDILDLIDPAALLEWNRRD
jgi:plasmid maintenance system antidote protein VapI